MHKIVFIVGESGCGKTYLRDNLIKNNTDKYCEIRSTVSRKQRDNESEDAYHFIPELEFEQMIYDERFLQYVKWGNNYYGTTIAEYDRPQDIGLFICTPVGISDTVKALKEAMIPMEAEIILFFTTNNLLNKHNTPQDRIERGNILEEFVTRYTNN